MALHRRSHPFSLLLLSLILISSLTACGQSADSGDRPPDWIGSNEDQTQGEYQAGLYSDRGSQVPKSIGFVFDPKGKPISNAALRNGDSSDLNGLLISYADAYAEGWAVIQKSGFLAGFARANQAIGEAYVFEARLTPLSVMIQLHPQEEQSLSLGELRDPDLEVSFPPEAFGSLPVIAGVAAIDPLDIGPLFEPLANGQSLSLQYAFGLQAVDYQGQHTPLSSGKTLGITIRDQGQLSGPITIASFDPDEGLWQVLPVPCSRVDSSFVFCEVDRISALIGLFTEGDPLWMPTLANLQASFPGQPGLMSPSRNPLAGNLLQSEGCDGPVGEAMDQELQSFRVIIGDMITAEAGLDSATMAGLMNDYAAAAFQYADLCKNEKGKGALLKVLGVELLVGLQFGDNWGWDPTSVSDKISELTIDRVQQELTEGKCLDMKEALGAFQEALMFGEEKTKLPGKEDETIEEAFERKKQEWSEACDLWTGTIDITHYPAGSHFGLEDWTVLNSNNIWTETHDIRISTHPDTHAITGRSRVTLNFPMILYAKTESEDPCDRNSFQSYYGFPSERMDVTGGEDDFENPADAAGPSTSDLQELFEAYQEDPASLTPEDLIALGELLSGLSDPDALQEPTSGESGSANPGPLEYGHDVTFSGTYDGTIFNISGLEYNSYAEILQYIYNEGEEDDKCVTEFEGSIPVHNYSTYLAHGFYGSPPITLQEILETPPTNYGELEIIRGSEEYSNPSTDIGSYPFDTSLVNWSIVHVQDQGIK